MPFHVVTGAGPDGRSTVISREERSAGGSRTVGMPEVDRAVRMDAASVPVQLVELYRSTAAPAMTVPSTREDLLPVDLGPGGILWVEMRFDGRSEQKLHRTRTIDFHYITGGETEIVLENGSAVLRPGDSLVVPGILHGWRSKAGWSALVFAVGLDPP